MNENKDHDSHVWRGSDSSYYDYVCKNCGAPEFTAKAKEECKKTHNGTA
jgi:hypothetical protein